MSRGFCGYRPFMLVFIMLMASLSSIFQLDEAAAAESGDLAVMSGISPIPGATYSAYDSIELSVEIGNDGLTMFTESRELRWYICEGTKGINSCIASKIDTGTTSFSELLGTGATASVNFADYTPGGDTGVFTIVFKFHLEDLDPSDDAISYQFNMTEQVVDVEIVEDYNPLPTSEDFAIRNGDRVYNTGKDLYVEAKAIASSCPSCGLEVEIGWRIYSLDGNTILKEDSTIFSDLPDWNDAPFKRALPALNHDTEGRFIFEWGVFSSSGTPDGDMNSHNNLARIEVVFDDTIDLVVESMSPAHSVGSTYYYGQDTVKVTVANMGNVTIVNTSLEVYVFDLFMNVDANEECFILDLKPDKSQTCYFSVELTGSKSLNATLSTTFDEGLDSRPSDNYIYEDVVFEVSPISPIIDIDIPERGYFVSSDTISLTARTDPNAASPLDYTWKRHNVFTFGTGRSVDVAASEFSLGVTQISVIVEDSTGERESAFAEFTVYNNTQLIAAPYVTGSATTTSPAALDFSMQMPEIGARYNTPVGTKPLMVVSLEVIPTSSNADTGMNWMEVDLNLSQILPSNVNYSSVQALLLQEKNSTTWTQLDSQSTQSNSNGLLTLGLPNASHILLAGIAPNANVSAGEMTIEKLSDGMMRLEMQPSGDLENPYFGGWSLFRVSGEKDQTVPFPDPQIQQSMFVWESLLANTRVTNLTADVGMWNDPTPLEIGECVSYAIVPYDREGIVDLDKIHVSKNDEGLAEPICGDAVAPSTTVTGLSANWQFTNSSDCFKMTYDWNSCYTVDVSWTWPDHEPEGNLTWNLYRVEKRPTQVDLSYIEPIISSMEAQPGTKYTLTQNGWDNNGVRPYRVYYYILAPIDAVGNLQVDASYPSPNSVRVQLEEQWFDANPQLIPQPEPEPEPPYGIEFLGKLDDQMQRSEFKTLGLLLLVIFVLNMLIIPIIIKRRTKLKRVVKRRQKYSKSYDDEDFSDFFD